MENEVLLLWFPAPLLYVETWVMGSKLTKMQYEGQAGQVAYAATKGAINSMTLPASRDLAEHNIRVVTIVPSPFDTPMTGK